MSSLNTEIRPRLKELFPHLRTLMTVGDIDIPSVVNMLSGIEYEETFDKHNVLTVNITVKENVASITSDVCHLKINERHSDMNEVTIELLKTFPWEVGKNYFVRYHVQEKDGEPIINFYKVLRRVTIPSKVRVFLFNAPVESDPFVDIHILSCNENKSGLRFNYNSMASLLPMSGQK